MEWDFRYQGLLKEFDPDIEKLYMSVVCMIVRPLHWYFLRQRGLYPGV